MSDEKAPEQTPEKPSDKELNFRALEAKHKQEMQQQQQKFASLQQELSEIKNYMKQQSQPRVEEDDDDPYIDHKKFEKKIGEYDRKSQEKMQTTMQQAINKAIEEDRKERWLEKNNDFYDVLKHADKLYETDQEFAETILKMPDTFERQKLVYKTIKNLGLHRDKKEEPNVQDQINARRTGAYYQPTGQSSSPYGSTGDFSPGGQKSAYDQMKQLQKRLRL